KSMAALATGRSGRGCWPSVFASGFIPTGSLSWHFLRPWYSPKPGSTSSSTIGHSATSTRLVPYSGIDHGITVGLATLDCLRGRYAALRRSRRPACARFETHALASHAFGSLRPIGESNGDYPRA